MLFCSVGSQNDENQEEKDWGDVAQTLRPSLAGFPPLISITLPVIREMSETILYFLGFKENHKNSLAYNIPHLALHARYTCRRCRCRLAIARC